MDWIQFATTVVAIIAVFLSVVTYVTNRRERRRIVKVSLSIGLITYGSTVVSESVIITCSNPGNRRVTVSSVFVLLPLDNTLVSRNQSDGSHVLPHDLEEGKSCTVWLPVKDVAENLKNHGFGNIVKFRGACRDAIGNVYKSKEISFSVDEWLNSETL